MNNQVNPSISTLNLPSLPPGIYIYTLSNMEKMTKGILWINQNR